LCGGVAAEFQNIDGRTGYIALLKREGSQKRGFSKERVSQKRGFSKERVLKIVSVLVFLKQVRVKVLAGE
jgi:hypothetical protein